MAKMHIVYQLTIRTLSPLHIGTGNKLLRDYDYVACNGKTWVIDQSVLGEMLYEHDPGEFERMASGAPAADLIHSNEFQEGSPLFRYVMRGEPRSEGRGAVLQELLKDPWDRPYIPGSSLKGALRTAFAVHGWQQRKLNFSLGSLNERGGAKYAALSMEQSVLNSPTAPRGMAPNHDLLRALQVSDSTPGDIGQVQLLNVQVAVGENMDSPIELEAIPAGLTFTATLTLDGFLLKRGVSQQMGWDKDQLAWLEDIPTVVARFSNPRLADEIEYWRDSASPIRSSFVKLVRTVEELDREHEFMLQLGWGGGWTSKTFNRHLTSNKDAFLEVVKKYRLDRKNKFQRGDSFPKSRRIAVTSSGRAGAPLGWVRVRMERVG